VVQQAKGPGFKGVRSSTENISARPCRPAMAIGSDENEIWRWVRL
jgi:hypothetical protein